MTWANLMDRALVPFEGRTGQLDTRVGKYLDEAQEDFSLYTKCYVRKFNIYISANKTYVELPDDFVEMVDSPIFRGGYLSQRTSNAYLYNQDTDTNLFNKGTPSEYYLEDRRLHLVPRPSQAGVLTLTYVAVPASLRTKTGMKKLRFDNLKSEYFRAGDIIKSRATTYGITSTNSIATVERADHFEPKAGILVISGLTNAFTTDNEDFFSTGDETTFYENQYSNNWDSILTTWNDLGLGGIATVNSSQYAYTETKPIIPDVYHYLLVDYAKAMIHQDIGNGKEYQNHYSVYLANREKAKTTVANQDVGGMSYVADRVGSGTY